MNTKSMCKWGSRLKTELKFESKFNEILNLKKAPSIIKLTFSFLLFSFWFVEQNLSICQIWWTDYWVELCLVSTFPSKGHSAHPVLPSYSQRSHGLFGNRVDSFASEPSNAQPQQTTHQRPLSFSESGPESPGPDSSSEFFPSTTPKNNTNNNAFAEWVAAALQSVQTSCGRVNPVCEVTCLFCRPLQVFLWKRRQRRRLLQSQRGRWSRCVIKPVHLLRTFSAN